MYVLGHFSRKRSHNVAVKGGMHAIPVTSLFVRMRSHSLMLCPASSSSVVRFCTAQLTHRSQALAPRQDARPSKSFMMHTSSMHATSAETYTRLAICYSLLPTAMMNSCTLVLHFWCMFFGLRAQPNLKISFKCCQWWWFLLYMCSEYSIIYIWNSCYLKHSNFQYRLTVVLKSMANCKISALQLLTDVWFSVCKISAVWRGNFRLQQQKLIHNERLYVRSPYPQQLSRISKWVISARLSLVLIYEWQ